MTMTTTTTIWQKYSFPLIFYGAESIFCLLFRLFRFRIFFCCCCCCCYLFLLRQTKDGAKKIKFDVINYQKKDCFFLVWLILLRKCKKGRPIVGEKRWNINEWKIVWLQLTSEGKWRKVTRHWTLNDVLSVWECDTVFRKFNCFFTINFAFCSLFVDCNSVCFDINHSMFNLQLFSLHTCTKVPSLIVWGIKWQSIEVTGGRRNLNICRNKFRHSESDWLIRWTLGKSPRSVEYWRMSFVVNFRNSIEFVMRLVPQRCAIGQRSLRMTNIIFITIDIIPSIVMHTRRTYRRTTE